MLLIEKIICTRIIKDLTFYTCAFMSSSTQTRVIAGIPVAITRKKMKSLRLRICSKTGMAKVSAPVRVSHNNITAFVQSNLQWIASQQALLAQQQATLKPYENGDTLCLLDTHVRVSTNHNAMKSTLQVVEKNNQGSPTHILLTTTPGDTYNKQTALLEKLFRTELKRAVAHIMAEYEPKMQLNVNEFGIKKMRTRWGTCNIQAKRIWLNLALAEHAYACLEYVVVHEMTHLLETNHTPRFWGLVEHFLPQWQKAHDYLGRQGC